MVAAQVPRKKIVYLSLYLKPFIFISIWHPVAATEKPHWHSSYCSPPKKSLWWMQHTPKQIPKSISCPLMHTRLDLNLEFRHPTALKSLPCLLRASRLWFWSRTHTTINAVDSGSEQAGNITHRHITKDHSVKKKPIPMSSNYAFMKAAMTPLDGLSEGEKTITRQIWQRVFNYFL